MTILLTGGSANGKSTFAEKLAVRFPEPRVYIATMRPYGEGALAKIERHRLMRADKGFASVECYTGVGSVPLEAGSNVLLECMCNLTANEMFDDVGNIDEGAAERVLADVLKLSERCANLIVVTNDVGSDVLGQYSDSTLRYIDTLGELNIELAERFDVVYELVAGIPILLKGTAL
ncbi:MAG: bifunctional adenosylcobinamide kinase/adenosylcobinamide-phosphate guanylyltransferase [Oscillospiraceae bacterium]|jgi:adenosylcobinamide kinase/adenosylcobinamide-phosphate guanylyltransferase|nr:bifunctional adenosylcobinamide kinase/adenosylcobinamide-phosphate guanylyltransferase [Oscillospiraceae bacterium]